MSLPAGHDDVPGKVTAALERIGQAFRVLAQEAAQEHGLSPVQVQILLRLATDPPERRRVGALARELDVSAASMSDSVSALERKGLVERRQLDEDRRGFGLQPSAVGRALATRLEAHAAPVERAVAELPVEEQDALMRTLYEVVASLQRAGVVTVARMCVTCRHFRSDVHAGESPHHCGLLDVPLAERDLRVDCPEHELAGGAR